MGNAAVKATGSGAQPPGAALIGNAGDMLSSRWPQVCTARCSQAPAPFGDGSKPGPSPATAVYFPGARSVICSVFASQKTLLPDQYACAAIMQATECENPWSTVAFGWVRLRRQSSQFVMWEGSSSPIQGGGSAPLGLREMSLTARWLSTPGSSSWLPFSST